MCTRITDVTMEAFTSLRQGVVSHSPGFSECLVAEARGRRERRRSSSAVTGSSGWETGPGGSWRAWIGTQVDKSGIAFGCW